MDAQGKLKCSIKRQPPLSIFSRVRLHFHFAARYVEQNKEDGSPYKEKKGAEIIYCEKINSWVLRHEWIQTSSPDDSDEENECSWLLRSLQTASFDIIEVGQEGSWSIWKGENCAETPICQRPVPWSLGLSISVFVCLITTHTSLIGQEKSRIIRQ